MKTLHQKCKSHKIDINYIFDSDLHARIQKVLSERVQRSKFVTVFVFFLVDEGIEDPNTAINGPSSARQQNSI